MELAIVQPTSETQEPVTAEVQDVAPQVEATKETEPEIAQSEERVQEIAPETEIVKPREVPTDVATYNPETHYVLPKADIDAMVAALSINQTRMWVGVALTTKIGAWFGAKNWEESQQIQSEMSAAHYARQK